MIKHGDAMDHICSSNQSHPFCNNRRVIALDCGPECGLSDRVVVDPSTLQQASGGGFCRGVGL